MKFFSKLSPLLVIALIIQLLSPLVVFNHTDIIYAAANGPVVVSEQPAKNTTNVIRKPLIEVYFDENIIKGDGLKAIRIRKEGTNIDDFVFNMNNSSVKIDKNKLYVQLTQNLELNTNYVVILDTDAVRNASNNMPLTTEYIWSFKTVEVEDNERPTISGHTFDSCTLDAATGNFTTSCDSTTNTTNLNPTNLAVKLTFSEPVHLGSGNILLSSSSGRDNRTISIYSSEVTGASTETINIKFKDPLLLNENYTLTVVGGNNANFKDAANNTLRNNYTVSFKTAATDGLQLQSFAPAATTNVELNRDNRLALTLTFNQSVLAVINKNISIRKVSDNTQVGNLIPVRNINTASNTFTYTSSAALAPDTEYYILVDSGSFVSTSGKDIYRGISNTTQWKFKTKALADSQPPTVSSTTPAKDEKNVARNDKIVITFSEPVYANSGTILIKNYSTNIIYRSINVTSARVTGAGTNTITIDPHKAVGSEAAKSFSANTRYYVEIPSGAFKDASNNLYRGTTDKNTINFTVGETTTNKPLLQSLSPINGTETIAAGKPKFVMTFNKNVDINRASTSVAMATPKQVTTAKQPIALTVSLNSDNKKVELIPQNDLIENTEYYITIPNDLIHDGSDNYFDGILNTYQWTFKTLGGDKVAPKIIRGEASGNKIRLVYDELLDESSVPNIGNYYITVNGRAKNISSIEVTKNAVVFTMYEQINNGDSVFISYTKPTSSPLRDLTKNEAASFVNQAAEYGQINAVPVIKSSSYSGRNITLEFTEPLTKVNALAYLQFKVTVNNVNNAVTSITSDGNKVTLGLSSSITTNRTVVVTYAKNAYPLVGFSNEVASFTHTVGTGTSTNTTAPTVTSITASNTTISINYNQSIVSAPRANQYTVQVNGSTKTVTGVTIDNQTVKLTIGTAIKETDKVTVSYSSASTTLLSGAGNGTYAPSFTQVSATIGESASGKVTLQGVIAKGSTVTLSFNKTLDSAYVPSANQFYLFIDQNNWPIRSVKIDGSNLILELSNPVKVSSTGTVSYYTTTDTLRTIDGERVGMLSNVAITNQTTVIDFSPNDYSSLPNGVLIKENAASKSNGTSPSGASVTQYTIDYTKVSNVVDALSGAGIKDAEIRFEVPASEKAAVVLFPMSGLQLADSKGAFKFTVKYGDIYYEVPTSSIDIASAVRLNGTTASSNYLVLKIESGKNSKTRALESSISSQGASLIGGPYLFEASINSSTRSSEVPLKGNLIRKVVIPYSVQQSQTTAVFYDEVAGTISGMPTVFSNSYGSTEVTFMRPGTSAYAIVTSNKDYNDINGHWANSTIKILSRKFIIEGHTATHFNPQQNITRGEFATYLVKGLGLSADKEAAKQFKDVNSASVLGGYIGAAAKAGIVSGVSSTEFKPNAYITRQDMAIMMMRVVTYTKMNVNLTTTPNSYLAPYSDANKVSSYAKTQVGQAIQIGIITGKTSTTISPLSNATRAEGVSMIERVLRKANYLQ